MALLGKHIREWSEAHGPVAASQNFSEALQTGKITFSDVSLRELAESLCGSNWAARLQAAGPNALSGMAACTDYDGHWVPNYRAFSEAGDAVDASMFADITGQILFNEIKARYQAANMLGDRLTSTIPVTNGNLGTQKTPWLSAIFDAPAINVQPGMPYPGTAFGQQYITYPAPGKFGLICRITMEMLYSDLTQQAREAAGDVGLRTRQEKEERILSVVLGLKNPHSWNGTTYNTYQTSTPWVNVVSSQTLVDWTELDLMYQRLVEMKDPVSNKAINVQPTGLLVMPRKKRTAMRIMTATQVRTGDGASNTQITLADSPQDIVYPVMDSIYAYNLLTGATATDTNEVAHGGLTSDQAKEYCYLGDFPRAFGWRQVYPLRVIPAPPNNMEDFNRDIVFQIKSSEYGVAVVRDPRYVVKLYNN